MGAFASSVRASVSSGSIASSSNAADDSSALDIPSTLAIQEDIPCDLREAVQFLRRVILTLTLLFVLSLSILGLVVFIVGINVGVSTHWVGFVIGGCLAAACVVASAMAWDLSGTIAMALSLLGLSSTPTDKLELTLRRFYENSMPGPKRSQIRYYVEMKEVLAEVFGRLSGMLAVKYTLAMQWGPLLFTLVSVLGCIIAGSVDEASPVLTVGIVMAITAGLAFIAGTIVLYRYVRPAIRESLSEGLDPYVFTLRQRLEESELSPPSSPWSVRKDRSSPSPPSVTMRELKEASQVDGRRDAAHDPFTPASTKPEAIADEDAPAPPQTHPFEHHEADTPSPPQTHGFEPPKRATPDDSGAPHDPAPVELPAFPQLDVGEKKDAATPMGTDALAVSPLSALPPAPPPETRPPAVLPSAAQTPASAPAPPPEPPPTLQVPPIGLPLSTLAAPPPAPPAAPPPGVHADEPFCSPPESPGIAGTAAPARADPGQAAVADAQPASAAALEQAAGPPVGPDAPRWQGAAGPAAGPATRPGADTSEQPGVAQDTAASQNASAVEQSEAEDQHLLS